jgi:hypothetical protein
MSFLADSGLLEQPDNFLGTAAALAGIAESGANAAASAGLALLLAEPLLKRLHKEDADAGCRMLLEALIGLQEAQVQLQQKVQDGVSKVSCCSSGGRDVGSWGFFGCV